MDALFLFMDALLLFMDGLLLLKVLFTEPIVYKLIAYSYRYVSHNA